MPNYDIEVCRFDDPNVAVQGATVKISWLSSLNGLIKEVVATTNEVGMALLTGIEIDGSQYRLKISKDGWYGAEAVPMFRTTLTDLIYPSKIMIENLALPMESISIETYKAEPFVVLAGVTVNIKGQGFDVTVISNESGVAIFMLPVGIYTITVSKTGYQRFAIRGQLFTGLPDMSRPIAMLPRILILRS